MRADDQLWCGVLVRDPEIPSTLKRPNSGNYRDAVTDHAISLLAQHGAAGVTLRSLADELQMSPQGVRRWFGSIDATWVAIANTFAKRWVQWQENIRGRDPECTSRDVSHLALPLNDSEVAATRAWFALIERCAHSDELASIVDPWLEIEASGIGRLSSSLMVAGGTRNSAVWKSPLEGAELTVVVALVRGLRLQMVTRHHPLGLVEARSALQSALPTLLSTSCGVHSRA